MTELLPVLASISLVDSTSVTPLGIVPLTSMLAGPRPYLTAGAFLTGLFVSYLGMGLAFLFGLSAVFMRLNTWLSHRWNHPEPADFLLELGLGIVLLVAGAKVADKRRTRQETRTETRGSGPGAAFGLGIMINVVGFPGALPFFAAADQILRADPTAGGTVLLNLWYVVVFLIPLALLVLLRRLLGDRGDTIMARVKSFFDVWGRRLGIVLLLTLGLLMTLDAALYLVRGAPLVPIGWPGT